MNDTTTPDNITVLPLTMSTIEEQFHAVLCEVADFNAIYETLQDKLKAREFALERKLAAAGQQLSTQLIEIQRSLEKFANFTTEEGAARSRMAIKQAKEETQASLHDLKASCQEIKHILEETETRLEQTITQSMAQVANISQTFPADEFKEVTKESCDNIKNTSSNAIKEIANFVKQFHRKNLIMAFVMTLFMAFVLGLYLNGEWPWEIHQQVLKERNAGRTLLTAWPKLTPAEQQAIVNAADRNPISN